MLTAYLASTAQRNRRNDHPIKLKRHRSRCHPDDVRDRIKRTDLMEVHVIWLNPMRRSLSPSQPSKHIQRPIPHSLSQPSRPNQPPNLSPSPRLPALSSSITLMPMPVPSLVFVTVSVPMTGGVREVLRV